MYRAANIIKENAKDCEDEFELY
jgi:hypothetical protein